MEVSFNAHGTLLCLYGRAERFHDDLVKLLLEPEASEKVNWMVGLLVGGITGWWDNWLVGLLVGGITGWWDYWLVGLLVGGITGWWDYWLVG